MTSKDLPRFPQEGKKLSSTGDKTATMGWEMLGSGTLAALPEDTSSVPMSGSSHCI